MIRLFYSEFGNRIRVHKFSRGSPPPHANAFVDPDCSVVSDFETNVAVIGVQTRFVPSAQELQLVQARGDPLEDHVIPRVRSLTSEQVKQHDIDYVVVGRTTQGAIERMFFGKTLLAAERKMHSSGETQSQWFAGLGSIKLQVHQDEVVRRVKMDPSSFRLRRLDLDVRHDLAVLRMGNLSHRHYLPQSRKVLQRPLPHRFMSPEQVARLGQPDRPLANS